MSTVAAQAPVGERTFRDALGHFASGVTIVTGIDEAGPVGFTCQSFFSVSTEPPLVSFSVMKGSASYPRIAAAGRFAVNILAEHQSALSDRFARKGTQRWAETRWETTAGGTPVLEDTLAWLECVIWSEHDAGDHLIVVGRVVDLGGDHSRSGGPLVYYRGAYGSLTDR